MILTQEHVDKMFTELAELKDGWFDGEGAALTGLDWLAGELRSRDLRPRCYPYFENHVSCEWRIGTLDVSVDVDLTNHTGYWHVLDHLSGVDEARNLDLNDEMMWAWIQYRISTLETNK